MSIAGKDALTEYSADDAVWETVEEVRNSPFTQGRDQEDDTVQGDQAHTNLPLLRNHSWVLNCLAIDPVGGTFQRAIMDACRAGTKFFIRVTIATTVFRGEVNCESFGVGTPHDGQDTFDFNLVNNGDWTVV